MTACCPSAEQHLVPRPSGGHIAFSVEGTGPVVLMIPSLGRGASDFDDLSRRFVAAGFTSVRPDPRGIGKSTGPMDGLTLHDLAADAALVIQALGGQPVVVVGHALGDRVELLDIDGAGHALLPEQPEKIAAAIIAFALRYSTPGPSLAR